MGWHEGGTGMYEGIGGVMTLSMVDVHLMEGFENVRKRHRRFKLGRAGGSTDCAWLRTYALNTQTMRCLVEYAHATVCFKKRCFSETRCYSVEIPGDLHGNLSAGLPVFFQSPEVSH
jgi:hypothetical protein